MDLLGFAVGALVGGAGLWVFKTQPKELDVAKELVPEKTVNVKEPTRVYRTSPLTRYSATNLHKIRMRKALTMTQLAKISGVPISTISHLENGAHERTYKETLSKLASALEVSASRLYL